MDAHSLSPHRFIQSQINVANVDPEKGTYAVGDFKTVALAGYIRAKVRLTSPHAAGLKCIGLGSPCLRWCGGWRDAVMRCTLSSDKTTTKHKQGGADAALTELVKKADSE